VALRAIALATRPEGAPLTVILRGEDARARRTGHVRSLQVRLSTRRNGGTGRPAGTGQSDLAAAARPLGLPPERARHGRRPGVGQRPTAPRSGPSGDARLSHAYSSMTSRLLRCVRAWPGRRRAVGAPLKPRTESCHGRTGRATDGGERFTNRRRITHVLNRHDTTQRANLGAYRA
jgi:hypothetical protein